MCNYEEDFVGIAKCKNKNTNLLSFMDKYVLGIIAVTLTLGVIFMGVVLYQLVSSL